MLVFWEFFNPPPLLSATVLVFILVCRRLNKVIIFFFFSLERVRDLSAIIYIMTTAITFSEVEIFLWVTLAPGNHHGMMYVGISIQLKCFFIFFFCVSEVVSSSTLLPLFPFPCFFFLSSKTRHFIRPPYCYFDS